MLNNGLIILSGLVMVMTVASVDLSEEVSGDLNQELEIRGEIVKSYDPGVRSGMPGPPVEGMDERLVNENPELESFVQDFFDADTVGDKAFRIRQMQNVELEGEMPDYSFTLVDQSYCEISTINGSVSVIAEDPLEVEIDEMNRSTRSVPC